LNFPGKFIVYWKSKKQTNVSRSYAESKYQAMANACLKLTWLRYILRDFKVPISMPTPLYCDNDTPYCNKSCISWAYEAYRDRLSHHTGKVQAMISPWHVSSHCQLSYIFTKPIGKEQFVTLRNKLGDHDIYSPTWGGYWNYYIFHI